MTINTTAANTTAATTGVVVASNPDDAAAVAAVEHHHAELSGRLSVLVEVLLDAASQPHDGAVDAARTHLVEFVTRELMPHAAAEESSLYPAAAAEERARLLVDGMIVEHRALERLVTEITDAVAPVRAAAAANGLRVLFEAHLSKENSLLLPLVAASPRTSLAGVLAGMHEIVGDADQPAAGCGGNCDCGDDDAGTVPTLDVRAVPHAIRHATVFGALDAVPASGALVLVAPHDPIPLLNQIDARTDGAFTVAYEERGPESWRLRLTRKRGSLHDRSS